MLFHLDCHSPTEVPDKKAVCFSRGFSRRAIPSWPGHGQKSCGGFGLFVRRSRFKIHSFCKAWRAAASHRPVYVHMCAASCFLGFGRVVTCEMGMQTDQCLSSACWFYPFGKRKNTNNSWRDILHCPSRIGLYWRVRVCPFGVAAFFRLVPIKRQRRHSLGAFPDFETHMR